MSSVAGRDSSTDRLNLGDSHARAARGGTGAPSNVWLDGEVLACACPDCGAPMSIRIWLALAECRMCGAQVELTEEQERQARELLEKREAGESPSGKPAEARRADQPWSQPVRPPVAKPELKPLPVLRAPGTAPKPPTTRRPAAPDAQVTYKPLIAEPVYDTPSPRTPTWSTGVHRLPPPPERPRQQTKLSLPWLHLIACLGSLLLNMLMIILLGLLVFPPLVRPKVIIIEASLPLGDSGGRKGSEVIVKTATTGAKGAEPISPIVTPPAAGIKLQELKLPQADLSALRKSIEASALENLPLSAVAGAGSPVAGTLLAGRDPRVRTRILNIEGGNERSELAVAMGLRWIAKHQNRDGSWSLDTFPRTDECRGRCTDIGVPSDTAATGMALLPFLGAGFTHRDETDYRTTVDDGLKWLVAEQGDDGSLMGRRVYGNTGMYAHGQATMALCEAYALTRDSKLRIPAQKAIDFIVSAQHSQGGWRYYPEQPGDTSVVGWQLMALRSAQMAGLNVPEAVFEKSNRFLASVQKTDSQALFGYMPGSGATETMTAEGLLCRLYSGWRTDFTPLQRGADWLLKHHLPTMNDANMYYWYYASQTMHHIGGARWEKWNKTLQPLLIEMQDQEGHQLGSWTPTGHHDTMGGRLYMTALAVCTLEVYYRHLPIYRQEATSDGGKKVAAEPATESVKASGTPPKRQLK
jgi:hypothetical protein